jgi:hypothetical protein
MAHRSFHFTASPAFASTLPTSNEKEQTDNKPVTTIMSPKHLRTTVHRKTSDLGIDMATSSLPSSSTKSTPSQPVVIPSRGHFGAAHRSSSAQWPGRKVQHGNGSSSRRMGEKHRPNSLPPAVAALLAVTSIPLPKDTAGSTRKRKSGKSHVASIQSTLSEAHIREKELSSSLSSVKSPLDILLSPPDDFDDDPPRLGGEARKSPLSLSASSESIPSLETDDESASSLSQPSTPEHLRRRLNGDRRVKTVSSPPPEECGQDHPLHTDVLKLENLATPEPLPRLEGSTNSGTAATAPATRSKSYLKSNLTASLRVLKSAARSFSNFATPIKADDFLTRSILSITPQYTDERRPLPLEDTPTPALRRYLNPVPNAPVEYRGLENMSLAERSRCNASIQMQTYKVVRPILRPTYSPIISRRSGRLNDDCASVSPCTEPFGRQREPRENSDFLRVIVLEMNMRREGKLDDKAPGRARFALPPRKPYNGQPPLMIEGVPSRWVGMVPEE